MKIRLLNTSFAVMQKGIGIKMLKGKCVILGITGGIAAYKAAYLASALKKQGADIHVIMTENACKFIQPLTFETLTGNKCITDTFDRDFQFEVTHVSLAKKADLIVVAPASANVIAKLAHGMADDMLTTTILASKAKKIVAPAMNTGMYENPVTQENLGKLKSMNFTIAEPVEGLLACNDVGAGKMEEPEKILKYIQKEIAREKDMAGLNVLVTAGPTKESIDPVRYITNHSTGKMGFALAEAAMLRGANVTLVSGETSVESPQFIKNIKVRSAEEMYEAVINAFDNCDILFKSAAVADYTPQDFSNEKVKKKEGDMSIPLKRTKDILAEVGGIKKQGQVVCGFAMETESLIENAKEKLKRKNLDIIVANSLKAEGAGFGADTNIVTIISESDMRELPIMSKSEVANEIIDIVTKLLHKSE